MLSSLTTAFRVGFGVRTSFIPTRSKRGITRILCSSYSNSGVSQPDPSSLFSVGDKVRVSIKRFTPLGAYVSINEDVANGLIFKNDLQMYQAKLGPHKQLKEGDDADAYILRISDDSKVDVSLRPPYVQRILETKQLILDALRNSSTGSIAVGDKSSAASIGAIFPGVSKTDFKDAVGALYRDGVVITSPTQISQQVHEQKREFIGKTLFVGNLPNDMPAHSLEDVIELAAGSIGLNVAQRKLRLVSGKNDTSPGVAFIEFASAAVASKMLRALEDSELLGNTLRVKYAIPKKAKLLAAPPVENKQ